MARFVLSAVHQIAVTRNVRMLQIFEQRVDAFDPLAPSVLKRVLRFTLLLFGYAITGRD